MNSRQKGFFFWGFPWFLAAVVLYLCIMVIRIYVDQENNPQQVVREFQQKNQALESELATRVQFLISNCDTNEKIGFHPKVELSGDETGDGEFFLFAFKNDSLLFWNNNQVILPADFTRKFRQPYFACQLKNGWYSFHRVKKGSYNVIGGYLVKSQYNFQNEFIHSEFSPRFDLPGSVSIQQKPGRYAVFAPDRSYLFSLGFDTYLPGADGPGGLFFLLFVSASLCLFYFIFRVYYQTALFRNRATLRFTVYALTLVVLRMIHVWSGFHVGAGQSDLFRPAWYSSSVVLPSLGDFTLNVTILLVISLVFHQTVFRGKTKRALRPIVQGAFTALSLLCVLLLFHASGYLISDLVNNASISLNLQNISGLTPESGFGLYIIAALFLSVWLISARIFDAIPAKPLFRGVAFPVVAAVCLLQLGLYLARREADFVVTLFFLAYVALYWYFKISQKALFSVQNLLFFLCFYALFGTFLLNRSNQSKETDKINLLAVKLATRRNPVTEVLYEQLARRIQADSVLMQLMNPEQGGTSPGQDSLTRYLMSVYFKDYWKKYQVQITFCDPLKELRIQPQGFLVNCNAYFLNIIDRYGESTTQPNFFFLDYGIGKEYYLAIISGHDFEPGSEAQPAIFVEFVLRNANPDPGYPGLLMDKVRMDLPILSDYSYGLYQNGRLVRAVGALGYKMDLSGYTDYSALKTSFSEDHVRHYQYRINDTDALLISKNDEDFLSLATPFPYLFILFSVIVLVLAGVVNFPKSLNPVPAGLRNRLHFSLIGILVLTMLAIGIVQVLYIIRINSKKNIDNLREKTYSVVVEVQHKYSQEPDMKHVAKGDLENFLVKLSNVFFSDINIFNARGMLISSSRPQIFEEGLLSRRMNATAYQKLVVGKNSIYIHHESIGSMQFNSAYLPFYSDDSELLGFVNLPYFARQDESKKEISSFLVTFINIYILLILLGVFVTVLIYKYITAPLALLAKKMSQLRLGMVNEKIPWTHQDEIGQLVSEYNRMIDALEKSAELLARSERETAWREMARQIAHEIKNPLTPMKLSTQYLEKAWLEKAPDWDQRLGRFTKTMVEQIDALSVIASDFSDFAKMPTVVPEKIDIEEVIRFVLALYQDTTPIRFEFHSEVSDPCMMADRSQIIRVFTNLFNNAVQAIADQPAGLVRVTLERHSGNLRVTVSDNGCGIPPDRTDKIFQPDFTTKTGGMGLGLAIVRAIVAAMEGEIAFTSVENEGTTFILKFPANGENS